MRFNLETSKLLYEVRYKDEEYEELYTYEQLFKDINEKYFIHFIGSEFSQYAVKTGYSEHIGREGNYYIDTDDIKMWKVVSNKMKEKHPEAYTIIDWVQEEKESLIWMGQMSEEELPF